MAVPSWAWKRASGRASFLVLCVCEADDFESMAKVKVILDKIRLDKRVGKRNK